MGICNFNFHFPAEGMLLVVVMYAFLSMALLKKTVKSMLEVIGGARSSPEEDIPNEIFEGSRPRRVSITRYGSLRRNRSKISARSCSGGSSNTGGNMGGAVDKCCVCLCRFEANEEVRELSCKHFFHKGCLHQWFDNHHSSCPLCRSIM